MGKKVARKDVEARAAEAAQPGAPLRILHVISGLGLGGAETVLFTLATHSRGFEHEVICLGPRDWYSDRLEERGFRVHHVESSSIAAAIGRAGRIRRLIKASPADLVQGWMYRGNVVGGVLARLAGKPVVWNVRSSTLEPLRLASRMLARIGGPLARWVPEYVINCSAESARLHARFGYDAAEGRTIPNGYSAARFYPDDKARPALRRSFGAEAGTFLLCTIGRWHAQKGFPELLEALRLVRQRNVPARLVMVGRDLDARNAALAKLIDASGVGEFVELAGERTDIPEIARAPDLHVLASVGAEAFPNVVAETMLSGTPNVVTEVGDAAFIVGDTGWKVAPGDIHALADAIQQAHEEWAESPDAWRERRDAARRRIADNFTLDRMVEAYEEVWRAVTQKRSPSVSPPQSGRPPAPSAIRPVSSNLDAKTVAGFGREWDHFDQSKLVGDEYDDLFSAYFGIFPFDDLPKDAEGFDLGCGSGRWAAGVASRVGKLHLIDPAKKALDVARKRLAGAGNVSFHLAPADAIPLPDASQDFGYSLGVLHHIPNSARALADAVRKLKPGAPFLLYIYYKLENRPAWFRFIWRSTDTVRRAVSRLPFPVARGVTSSIAAAVYWPLARAALVAEKVGLDPSNIPLSSYRHRSFYTMRTDALDRFGTRLEQRFTRAEIEQMMRDAGLTDIRFSDRPPYWVACGKREREASSSFGVSVVIPLYNKEQAVETTLKSVLRQTRPPDEVIIVDDGSTDESVAVIRQVLEAERSATPVRIITQENLGVSVARNRGADEARCEYIAFLDADDEWLPNCLAEFEKLARHSPDAGLLTVLLAKITSKGLLIPERSALPDGFFGQVPNPLETYSKGYGLVSSSSVAVRRDAWRRSGGFPAGVATGEDICWWVKLLMQERVAHSAVPLSIWHDEFSGAADRKGTVPHHFSYFLGTDEGRKYLKDPCLVQFLGSNLPVQIGGRRLADDRAVVSELRRLSSSLPMRFRTLSLVISIAPRWLLRRAISWRRGGHRRRWEGAAGQALPAHRGDHLDVGSKL